MAAGMFGILGNAFAKGAPRKSSENVQVQDPYVRFFSIGMRIITSLQSLQLVFFMVHGFHTYVEELHCELD